MSTLSRLKIHSGSMERGAQSSDHRWACVSLLDVALGAHVVHAEVGDGRGNLGVAVDRVPLGFLRVHADDPVLCQNIR